MDSVTLRARRVDERLMAYLEDGGPERLVKAVRHYPEAGGKRLRPVLAMMVADAVSGEGERTLPFGCCLELIHNFTLVHDDVMDQDTMRRGRPAVHVLFDVPTAIIAGDALFARAFEVLAETDVRPETLRRLLRLVSETIWTIAEGQQMDIDFESRETVGVAEYMEMIEKKTAVLFACAARGAAMVAEGNQEQEEALSEYARLLGLGFQIWDDVLGITADEGTLGKPVGSDIRNGKRTLIVLHALESAPPEEREALLSILGHHDATDEEVADAVQILQEVGSVEFARSTALDYAENAKRCLDCLNESEHKTLLRELVDYSVRRER